MLATFLLDRENTRPKINIFQLIRFIKIILFFICTCLGEARPGGAGTAQVAEGLAAGV